MKIKCDVHGELEWVGMGDFIGDTRAITLHCPKCEEETRNMEKMELDYKLLGDNIRYELKKRKWEQQELAIVLRIDQSLISRYLTGERKIPLEVAVNIAELFDMTIEELTSERQNE